MQNYHDQHKKSLSHSTRDGVFASLMSGLTLDYFTPFLLFLGGSVRQVGLLSALPNLVASIIQLKSPDIEERLASRKKVITIFVLLQALTLPPMILTWYMGGAKVAVYIALVTMFTSFGAFVAPAWGSLMADLVEEDKRGEYFGWRNRLLGFVSIGGAFASGFILHQAQQKSLIAGFTIIFALAFIARLISWHHLNRMHDPWIARKKEDYFSIFDFVARIRHSNFARFVLFVSLMKFAVYIASPFFAVFMLRDLKLGYFTYTAITLSATLAMNLSIKRWGVHSDRVGNLKVVRLCSRLVVLLPFLWLVSQNVYWLVAVQVFSGFAWAGFNLATTNFVYDASTPGKRTRCIAYLNFFGGISICLGAMAGGLIEQLIPEGLFTYTLFGVMAISGGARLLTAFLMPNLNLNEVRPVEKVRSHELFFRMVRPGSQRAGR